VLEELDIDKLIEDTLLRLAVSPDKKLAPPLPPLSDIVVLVRPNEVAYADSSAELDNEALPLTKVL
jgi:hypothetical protein